MRYYIDEKNGVVVCIIENTTYDAIDYIQKRNGYDNIYLGQEFHLKDSYKGIARCNLAEGDTFDEEYGKELARHRAIEKLTKDKTRAILKYKERLLQMAENV